MFTHDILYRSVQVVITKIRTNYSSYIIFKLAILFINIISIAGMFYKIIIYLAKNDRCLLN